MRRGKVSSSIVFLRNSKPQTPERGQMLLTVPLAISEHLLPQAGKAFRCELTPDGILFRPVPEADIDEDVPEWVNP